VRTLPFNEGPEVFGLHDNANISSAISETNLLLETALSLQPRSDGGSGKGWGEILAELSQDISNRIPAVFDIEKALILFPVKYEESMNTVLTQVIERFSLAYSLTHSLAYSLTHLLTYSLTHWLTHLLTNLLTHSLAYLLTHSLTYLLIRN
jgi:dynein heavy chain